MRLFSKIFGKPHRRIVVGSRTGKSKKFPLHTVLEDFYAVGALADELTHGFHMEERGYIDRTEVNSRLIAFARELERILDKWETHAVLIA